MKRPVLWALPFLVLGIFFSRSIYPVVGFLPLCLIAIGIAAVVAVTTKTRLALFFPLLTVAGFFLLRANITDKYEFLYEHARSYGYVELSGTAGTVSKSSSGRTTVVLAVDSVTIDGIVNPVKINVQVYLDVGSAATPGARVTAAGKLNPLRFRRNPGGYDEFTYLRSRKIDYIIYPLIYEESTVGWSFQGFLAIISGRLTDVLYRTLPQNEADLMAAMLLGNRTGLNQEAKDVYHNAGVFHILAVSGLHVSVIALFLEKLLRKARLAPRAAGLTTVAILILYCLLTGAAPGTVRAGLMSGIFILGGCFSRKSDGLSACAFAAICLLLYEPLYLWDMGFQYSFLAVAGLIALTPAVERFLSYIGKKIRWIDKLLKTTFLAKNLPGVLAATIATFPVVTYYYYEFPIIGILANLLIIPTVIVTVASGFAVSLLGLINVGVAKVVSVVPRLLLQMYTAFCQTLAAVPFARIFTGRPALWVVVSCYAAMAVIAGIAALKEPVYRRFRGGIMSLTVLGGLVIVIGVGASMLNPLTITILDVGQGDSAVISQGNAAIAIDGGGTGLHKLGNDTGRWDLLPYMSYLGVEKLDAAFVSHTDSDHAIGIIEAVQAGRVRRLYLPDADAGEAAVYDELITAAKVTGTEVIYLRAGEVITFWDCVTVDCLYPLADKPASGNDASLLLRVTAAGVRLLFTGDMEAFSERAAVAAYRDGELETDILKVAHHGSRTSTIQDFLNAVSPLAAVVSASATNSYGHPHVEVTDRLAAMDIPLYNTAQNGAIMIYPSNDAVKIKTMAGKADERVKQAVKFW